LVGADVDETLAHVLQVVGTGHLRHQHRVGLGLGYGVEIVQPPLGVETVDAHDDLARPEGAGCDGLEHLLAGGGLALGRNRILEVENDGVGR